MNIKMHCKLLKWSKLFVLLCVIATAGGYFGTELKDSEPCFCKLQEKLDDCSCNADTVDYFNNVKVFPRLQSIVAKDYFRFYKVSLKKECPFWVDDSRCAMKHCHVKPCEENAIPQYLKGDINLDNEYIFEGPAEKYSRELQKGCTSDFNDKLGYLNKTISAKSQEEFDKWTAHDDAKDNFCIMDDMNYDAEYVDLSFNPERYTGYKGKSAHRIWNSIYMENCFRPTPTLYHSFPYIENTNLGNLCLEKRVFYRAISGLHASINIHLSAKYLLTEKNGNMEFAGPSEGVWGPNLEEFQRRFDPSQTSGEGPFWLKNLYFLYLLEMRAIAKAGPLLEREEYYTGNDAEDAEMRAAVRNLLSVIHPFPNHFNETTMFTSEQAIKLKEEFRNHFMNISRIMDCVGCEKCKLWGKLQIQGLGTALKILFSGKFDMIDPLSPDKVPTRSNRNAFKLSRTEIVALFNAFGRLSTSVRELETFRNLLR